MSISERAELDEIRRKEHERLVARLNQLSVLLIAQAQETARRAGLSLSAMCQPSRRWPGRPRWWDYLVTEAQPALDPIVPQIVSSSVDGVED